MENFPEPVCLLGQDVVRRLLGNVFFPANLFLRLVALELALELSSVISLFTFFFLIFNLLLSSSAE
jgi:hypothetical protein